MSGKINIKILKFCNLTDVAKIHVSAFPGSLITKLGIECVIKYYEWQLESPDKAYAIGVFNADKMLGYCFGGVFSMALGGFLFRNKRLIIKRLITHPWLMFHPVLIKKILFGLILLMKFSKKKDSTTKAPSITEYSHFGILAIASTPAARGLGVGRILMAHSEKHAREQNFKKMFLTVNPKNTNAVEFYEHIGWVKDSTAEYWKGGMKKDLMND
jgi:ribosomal protein S18 acetylase RimI-like enzyme